jgi:hypothetical protein
VNAPAVGLHPPQTQLAQLIPQGGLGALGGGGKESHGGVNVPVTVLEREAALSRDSIRYETYD